MDSQAKPTTKGTEGTLFGAVQILAAAGWSRADVRQLVDEALDDFDPAILDPWADKRYER